MRCSRKLIAAWLFAAPGCAPPVAPSPAQTPPSVAAAQTPAAPAPIAAPVSSPARGPMTLARACRYMFELINRDRASAGLPPVSLDEDAATRAGQSHTEDMAKHGYLGHWGTDGSVPEQRFTEAGGTGMVMENASCFTDEKVRVLDLAPEIDPRKVEATEAMFFHEQPPHDGHRQNILKPWHTRVGIGIAQPIATATETPVPCFSQEFVDDYGTYAVVPRAMQVRGTLHVAGSIAAPARFAGVGLARFARPTPLAVAELNRRRSYPVPKPYEMYWPPGFQTPIPVAVHGRSFSIDVPLDDGGKPGMYEVSVWANVPGSTDLVMVSLRTIQVN